MQMSLEHNLYCSLHLFMCFEQVQRRERASNSFGFESGNVRPS